MSVGKRARGSSITGGLSLFPFLAVLICVMGALIVLLVVLARHARVQATRAAQTVASQKKLPLQEIQQQRELLQWQAEQIQESRAKTEAQLAEARLQLGGAEDHLRKLREEWQQLERAWQALQQTAPNSAETAQLEDRLRQLEAKIARTKAEVAQKAQTPAKRPVCYAIIPYQGPYGTTRRPIYIECQQDAVILQPEGIRLGPQDFEGPITHENPLARAVRSIREYWANQTGPLRPEEEPYPLLLVRPDGIAAYYAAREALQAWGSEFGYELIEQDWKLKFPQPDPHLAQLLRQEVQLARARQEVLAKIAPRVASRARPTYRVGTRGIQIEQSPGGGPDRPQRPRFGTSPHPGGNADIGYEAQSGPLDGHRTLEDSAHDGIWEGQASGVAKDSGLGQGSGTTKDSFGSGEGQATYRPGAEASSLGEAHSRSQIPSTDSLAQPHRLPQGQPTEEGTGGFASAGSPSSGLGHAPSPGGLQQGQAGSGSFVAPGPLLQENPNSEGGFSATRALSAASPPSGSDQQSFSTVPGRPLRPGEWYDRPPEATRGTDATDPGRAEKSQSHKKDLTSLRGRNWALPDATANAIPITRPIAVECYADRLVIGSESSHRKEIRLGRQMLESVDEMVGTIWEQMESWGIAGRGMYWRPVLSVRVAPGAEARFQELQTLLEGSGVRIERVP